MYRLITRKRKSAEKSELVAKDNDSRSKGNNKWCASFYIKRSPVRDNVTVLLLLRCSRWPANTICWH